MARIERQEWFSRPVETPDDWLVLVLLRESDPASGFLITVEEPFGGSASVGVRFLEDGWESGLRTLLGLEAAARDLVSRARPLSSQDAPAAEARLVEFEFQGEVRRFAVPVR